ncbi:DsbA family protein [Paenibacillus durus]|uniref:Disulfide dehydrogenase n=1 Tax=Paenibacillus durus ATCC 35681 TaxID=1333534 RepID=A0A0F7CI28_PAEDU|nr:thioredoxin domain-containing protein [Paenibacillus durus]AKG34971.1 disulfide dehydrogenase [Paenibacillus durus ATCC 35681]
MSKSKKNGTSSSIQNKQERRQAELERQKKKTRILLIGTILLTVVIFAGLFVMAYKNTGNPGDSGSPASFNYDELPRLGKADAPIKLVEFGDFKCPACARFSVGIKPLLVQEYIETGKVALYFVNMSFIGPDSETASLAALSVYHQNSEAFWTYYDALYANQGDENAEWATEDFLVRLAQNEKLPIDYNLLRKDIQNRTYSGELERDNAIAKTNNVKSTPSLFINGIKASDPLNISAISAEIESAAKAAKAAEAE